ncbi:MAG: GDP-mannose 4,6-dehydratase [Alphaproteobacteria bacterium]|nr:GDP-mannose 4,6-dehydratase [Alphaproteobacteria bacterium]
MTSLVTGGCGFIGSHLVEKLLQQGEEVIVVDNLSTGKRENLPANAELIEGDIVDANIFTPLLDRVNHVYHLAAVASVDLSRSAWYHAHKVNIGGTVNLLHSIAQSGKDIPVVYASSAAVYGDCDQLPLSEGAPAKPLSAYGIDKLSCENHARIATSIHNIPTAGLRFFNVYGPRQDPHSPYSGVISIFMQLASEKKALTIFGNGQQSRDFVYVDDVVQTLYVAMQKLDAKAIECGVFNVGTCNAVTIKQLAEQIRTISGHEFSIHYGPAREGDIQFSYCDNSLAKSQLGYTPTCKLEEGLRKTYGSVVQS